MTLSHLGRAGAVTMGGVAAMLWPCAPGSYDPLALPLSLIARIASWSALVFVPVGVIWWCRDVLLGRPAAARPLSTVVIAAAVAVSAAIVLAATAFAGLVLALVSGIVAAIVVRWRAPRWTRAAAGTESGALAMLYLAGVPVLMLMLQLSLFDAAVRANRSRVIAAAAPLIAQLESYRGARGQYPESLLSVTTDYRPRSVGVTRFSYARSGDAYTLAFEQPPAALDMREFVVYHPAGQSVLFSHDSDLLLFEGEALERRRGFPSSADVPGHAGWRVLRFD